MRQQEGAWISTSQVERGKLRLQRTGYFRDVNVETPLVSGVSDQVDVNYAVEEAPGGQFGIGLGFSQTEQSHLLQIIFPSGLKLVYSTYFSGQ